MRSGYKRTTRAKYDLYGGGASGMIYILYSNFVVFFLQHLTELV